MLKNTLSNLRSRLTSEIAVAREIRKEIQATSGMERYEAWSKKRRTSCSRRALHLASCFVRGTAYASAESKTALSAYERKLLIKDITQVLNDAGTALDPRAVEAWMGGCAITPATKLYVVVRADLSPGAQAVQSAHALREFAREHEVVEREWHEHSNTLAMLAVADEPALKELIVKATTEKVPFAIFQEPDFGNATTAVVIAPTGRFLVRGLKLALAPERAA